MATPEGKVKTKLDKMFRSEGVWFYSPQAGPYGASGIPDRIGIVTGLFFAVECKADASKKMTALQELTGKKIKAAGGKFFLVYDDATIEEVRQWIVSTRSRRQEGSDCNGGRSCRCTSCLAVIETAERELASSPAQTGRDDSSEELGVQRTQSNPVTLSVAWEI